MGSEWLLQIIAFSSLSGILSVWLECPIVSNTLDLQTSSELLTSNDDLSQVFYSFLLNVKYFLWLILMTLSFNYIITCNFIIDLNIEGKN